MPVPERSLKQVGLALGIMLGLTMLCLSLLIAVPGKTRADIPAGSGSGNSGLYAAWVKMVRKQIDTELASKLEGSVSLCSVCSPWRNVLAVISCGPGWKTGDVPYHTHHDREFTDVTTTLYMPDAPENGREVPFILEISGVVTIVQWQACAQTHSWHPVSKQRRTVQETPVTVLVRGRIVFLGDDPEVITTAGSPILTLTATLVAISEPYFRHRALSCTVEVDADGKAELTHGEGYDTWDGTDAVGALFDQGIVKTVGSVLAESMTAVFGSVGVSASGR